MAEPRSPAIGIRLPTLLSQGKDVHRLGALAEQAEAAGFDALWCVDHLLAADYVFGAPSLDPLVTLSYLAGLTRRPLLGVSVLVSPLRHPTWMVKQLGSLSHMCGERVLLGLGVGWDDREFAVSGVDRRRRGARLDALLAQLEQARSGSPVVIDGYRIEPAPSRWAGVLCGGGSSVTVLEDGRPARLTGRVLDRIARSDGWVARSSADVEMVRSDLESIAARRRELGKSGAFEVARATFIHISTRTDTDAAIEEQIAALGGIGWRGDRETFVRQYPCGTIADVVRWLSAQTAAGATQLILHPVGDVARQIELLAEHVLAPLRRGSLSGP